MMNTTERYNYIIMMPALVMVTFFLNANYNIIHITEYVMQLKEKSDRSDKVVGVFITCSLVY